MTQTPEQQRVRYWADPEEKRRKNREYNARNRDKRNTRSRELRALNLERERERDRARGPAKRHGMQPEDWTAMWAAQDGRCYLCGEEMTPGKEHVDHDHACCPKGKSCPICRRGLAHHLCNVIIGQLQDDPALMRRIADNLEAAQLAFRQRLDASPAGEPVTLF